MEPRALPAARRRARPAVSTSWSTGSAPTDPAGGRPRLRSGQPDRRCWRERWPDADVLGIDSSPDMIAAARGDRGRPERPNLAFAVGDIADWQPGRRRPTSWSATPRCSGSPATTSVIRHWRPRCRSGGVDGVPGAGQLRRPVAPADARARRVSPRWARRLDPGVADHASTRCSSPTATPHLMLDCGWRPDVWETTYLHLLAGPDPVLDWVRGTGLRPILAALDPVDAREFEAEYAAGCARSTPPDDGPERARSSRSGGSSAWRTGSDARTTLGRCPKPCWPSRCCTTGS